MMGEESVCASVRRDTISSHLLIGVVRRQTLLDHGESQYPVPMMVPVTISRLTDGEPRVTVYLSSDLRRSATTSVPGTKSMVL